MAKGVKRHVPLRTCVICGNKSAKRDLMRLAAGSQGRVELDPTGNLPGRGAYVCADGKCAHGDLRKSRIEHALRTKVNDEVWAVVTSTVEAAAP